MQSIKKPILAMDIKENRQKNYGYNIKKWTVMTSLVNNTPITKLLFTKAEAMEMLGVGEKVFRRLLIPSIKIGERRRYALADLQTFINRNREDPSCLSPAKGKARRTGGTTSRSEVIGFEEALKLNASRRRQKSSQS